MGTRYNLSQSTYDQASSSSSKPSTELAPLLNQKRDDSCLITSAEDSARAVFFNTGHTASTTALKTLTLVAVACPPSSAEGLKFHGDVPATNGALVEPIGVHAYLETNEHTLRARFIGFLCGFQHDVHHPQTRPK